VLRLLQLLARARHGAPTGATPPAALPNVRAARAGLPPRALQSLLPVLVPDWPRAPARPSTARGDTVARLPAVRAADDEIDPRAVPQLLRVLASDRPRASARAVAALMDPPEGYAAVTCPAFGRGYQTLQAAPVAFCSVACADTERRPSTPPAEPSHLFRAGRCSYCQEPMRVAPRLHPPFRCPRCAGWRGAAD
jgi:hypothetical protein